MGLFLYEVFLISMNSAVFACGAINIDITEFKKALKDLKNNRTPCEDQIIPELIKYGDHTLLQNLKILLNKCLEVETILSE